MAINIDRLMEDYFPFETIYEGEPDWKKVNPLASDEQPEDRNGRNGEVTGVNGKTLPETSAALSRRYRLTTNSLVGGDRDKNRALGKWANRLVRTLQADNKPGHESLIGATTPIKPVQ